MENQETTNLGGIFNSANVSSNNEVGGVVVNNIPTYEMPTTNTSLYNGISSTEIPSVTSVSNAIESEVQPAVDMKTVEEQPVVTNTEVKETTIEVSNRLVVNTKELQKMISQAKKLAVGNILLPTTQVIYLVFGSEGFRVYATDSERTIDVVNKSRKFNQEVRISVDCKKFADLVSKLDDEETEFVYNEEQFTISVVTSTGSFIFPQSTDMTTGMPLQLDHKFKVNSESVQALEYNALVETINKSKPIRKSSEGDSSLQGIYFTDIIISTDSNLILMQDTLASLKNREFYMESTYSDLLASLTVNNDTCKLGLDVREGKIVGIVVSDDVITLSGPVKENTNIPLDLCKEFWNTSFDKKITIDTRKCMSVLQRVAALVNHNSDDENATFNIGLNGIEIITLNGEGRDSVSCNNETGYSTSIKLPIMNILNLLGTVVAPSFKISINPETQNCVCFEFDNYKCIVALSN